jgi:toxin CcdB
MHQFAVCRLRPQAGRGRRTSVVVLQHDELSSSRTRIVAPLLKRGEVKQVKRLHPSVRFRGDEFLLVVDRMSAVDVAQLGPPEATLDQHHDEIISALDLLFTGY